MRVRYVTLQWDQRPREFEQSKCDIAWLVWKEISPEGDTEYITLSAISTILRDNHGFSRGDSYRYAIAVTRCGYNPVTTLTSSIREETELTNLKTEDFKSHETFIEEYGLMDSGF